MLQFYILDLKAPVVLQLLTALKVGRIAANILWIRYKHLRSS